MAGFRVTDTISGIAGAALAANRRVKKSSGKFVYASATEKYVGVTVNATFADGDPVTIKLRSSQGTILFSSAGVIGDGVEVFAAANGQIAASGTAGYEIGISNEAGVLNQFIEVIPY